jgi:hypothetical protein
MKEDKIDWTFSMHGREEKYMQRFHKKIREAALKTTK